MAMDAAGKTLGMALKDWNATGKGKILALVQPGWHGGPSEAKKPYAELLETEVQGTEAKIAPGAGRVQFVLHDVEDEEPAFSIALEGKTGPSEVLMSIDGNGELAVKGGIGTRQAGLAECHPVLEPVETGDVLVADAQSPGWMRKCSIQADPAVVGIVADNAGIVMARNIFNVEQVAPGLVADFKLALAAGNAEESENLWLEMEIAFLQNFAPVALAGTVPCKADASYGEIGVGDLLCASPTPGHAMRAESPLPGTVVAKALEPLQEGKGVILVLVMMR